MLAINWVIMLMSASNNNLHNNQNGTNLAGTDVITEVAYEVNLVASGKDWVMLIVCSFAK